MKAFVEQKELEQVKSCLETTPVIKGELGNEWIVKNLLNAERRETKHFLFWFFLEDWKIKKMEKWLKDLKTCIPQSKYRKIINRLKEKRTEKDFKSLISEIEVLSYYANLGIKVDYEPSIPDKSNVGDIKLTVNSNEIFLEVTRLFASIAEEARDSLVHSVVDAIEAIQENPFIISVAIEDGFSTYDVEPCLKLVCEEILKNRHKLEPTEDNPYVVTYGSVYCPKATFTFLKRITNKKGYVGGSLLPFVELNDAGRLKNKILGELRQLPDNRFNVIVIDISHYFIDFDDVQDAFIGQLGFIINRQTGEGRTVRNTNGVIHMKDGRQVGLIIAFKGFNYEKRKKYENKSATLPFTEDLLAVL